jgi:sirohydrochlorin ferrochelatase
MRPLLLVAHGSRDPRAANTTRALARVVAAARPGLDIRVSFLELAEPGPAAVLRTLGEPAVVVPLLLTNAYHGRIDLPAQVSGFDVALAPPLGQAGGHLLDGLVRNLHAAIAQTPRSACQGGVCRGGARRGGARAEPPEVQSAEPPEVQSAELPVVQSASRQKSGQYNGIVVAAAGTRVREARATVEEVALALSRRLGVPAQVAYAAGAQPSGGDAVRMLRKRGADQVAVVAYFLAYGQLYATVTESAVAAGAVAVAEPLGASYDLAQLVLDRYDECLSTSLPKTSPELSFSNA